MSRLSYYYFSRNSTRRVPSILLQELPNATTAAGISSFVNALKHHDEFTDTTFSKEPPELLKQKPLKQFWAICKKRFSKKQLGFVAGLFSFAF